MEASLMVTEVPLSCLLMHGASDRIQTCGSCLGGDEENVDVSIAFGLVQGDGGSGGATMGLNDSRAALEFGWSSLVLPLATMGATS
ncbi:unnamed protein product [Prunus armeniaca]